MMNYKTIKKLRFIKQYINLAILNARPTMIRTGFKKNKSSTKLL
ncbi:hypothetical protein GGU45_000199 [Niabella hirudinis]